VTRFEQALTLWRGIPELPDGQRGLSEMTRWVESHAALVEDRADALLATGRAAEVISDLEAAIFAQDTSLDIAVAQFISSVTRAVTFVLTDIEGSTAAWEADAASMAIALARHDEPVVTPRGGMSSLSRTG
jgi:class 3 adenylate cyclase